MTSEWNSEHNKNMTSEWNTEHNKNMTSEWNTEHNKNMTKVFLEEIYNNREIPGCGFIGGLWCKQSFQPVIYRLETLWNI